jgi:hypothetical protein
VDGAARVQRRQHTVDLVFNSRLTACWLLLFN